MSIGVHFDDEEGYEESPMSTAPQTPAENLLQKRLEELAVVAKDLERQVKRWQDQEVGRASCCVAHETALLDIKRRLLAFKEATHGLPLGQEDIVKGSSVFNWRVAHERELVDPLLAQVEAVLNSPLSLERDQAEKAVKGK